MKYVDTITTNDAIIENAYSSEERKKLLDYMSSFNIVAASGLVYDLKDKVLTNVENLSYIDNNDYCWETNQIYHLKKYGAKLSEDFTEYVLSRN